MYNGLGYNIFKGNIMAHDGVDKGFRAPILDYHFQGAHTPDGVF